jgi:uncharacterized protein (TIGR02996 family)
MNDLDMLRAAIVANPDEDAPVVMYADALQEAGTHTFLQAVATALQFRQATVANLHLVQAARVLVSDGADDSRLREAIRKEHVAAQGVMCFFALVDGNRPPELWLNRELPGGAVMGCGLMENGNFQLVRLTMRPDVGLAVLIGSEFVLNFAREHGFAIPK